MEQDDKPGGVWDEFASKYEARFIDLIESDDWWLVDSSGRPDPILIPNFDGNGVIWRLDRSRLDDRPNGGTPKPREPALAARFPQKYKQPLASRVFHSHRRSSIATRREDTAPS
jgi:hypothetical protein